MVAWVAVSLAALQWAGALAALQLLGGLLLLYGGVRARAGPLLAWLLLALPAAPALLAALYAGSQYPCLLYLFGGPLSYRNYPPALPPSPRPHKRSRG